MTGYVVFTVACLLTAIALPVGYAWSRLQRWRYPRPEDTLPSSEPVGPLPAEAVQLWSAHDPTSLGFVHLGDLRAGPSVGKDALTRYWVDAPTRTTVATVTFIPGINGRPAGRRRGFFTLHGDIAEPGSLQVSARSSAGLHHFVRPGSQVLYWPAADQLELLRVHRRQQRLVSTAPLPVSSLDELRELVSRANHTHHHWLIRTGVLREEADGRLSLRRKTLLTSVWRTLPTAKTAVSRADRRARRVVAGWPEPDPAEES